MTNHKEAYELACQPQENSNLARCYLETRVLLRAVWHAMNGNMALFPMRGIEAVLGIEEIEK